MICQLMERKLWEESHHLVFVCEVLGLEIKSEETELHQERQKATRKWKCRNIDSKRKKEPFAFCDGVKIGFDWFYLIF